MLAGDGERVGCVGVFDAQQFGCAVAEGEGDVAGLCAGRATRTT
jgi:hypothetical protein